MRNFLLTVILFITGFNATGQDNDKKDFTPYIAVWAGGCVDNPFQFAVGIQKPIQSNWSIAYDVHYWKTGYECYCDDMYSTGDFRSITPSVKVIYSTGKKEGRGLMAGIGLGYMFAKDRGTEQTYEYDELAKTYAYGISRDAKWDFNSIAPSFSVGVGLRVFKLPVSLNTIYYFAKTTEGWLPVAGGAGFKIGFRKLQ
ncbi:MAG: hypothetical protein HOP10_14130 [Chitinophagaceae bacterium]|nr:hypothetical protein [Chitinophagaceae bacterium]